MKNKNKETFNKKIIILGVICLIVAGITIGLSLDSTLATDDASNITDENHIELDCKEYISFENKLTCKVSVTIASGQEISSINLNLSDTPEIIDNLLDSSYESTILNEGNYVDIIFGNDIVTNENPIKLDVVNVTFDNITEEKLVATSDVFFLNSNYAIVDENISITNPTTASALPVFDIELRPSSPQIIDDKYYYNYWDEAQGTLYESITDYLNSSDAVTIVGCTYKVSDDGTILTITDNYGNNKILKVIYASSNPDEPILPWNATMSIYSRGMVTKEEMQKQIIKTNGYIMLTDNEIQLYGDAEYTDLIDSRSWLYIKSDTYDFTNNIVNIPERVSYEEFINNIEFHGVTGVLYDINGEEITNGYLGQANKLTISGIPGWGTEDITINTEISDYIEINDINVLENSGNNYIMYDIPANTTIGDFLNKIETNGTVKVYDANDRLISTYGDFSFISTNMSIEITLSDKIVHYDISVLGDIVGKGTVYLSDIVKLYKIHRGKIEPTQAEIFAGDVVNDNNIDLLDVAKLYRYYRGVEESLK